MNIRARLVLHVLTDGFAIVGYFILLAGGFLCWTAITDTPFMCDPIWSLPHVAALMPDHAVQCSAAENSLLANKYPWYAFGAALFGGVIGIQAHRIGIMLCGAEHQSRRHRDVKIKS